MNGAAFAAALLCSPASAAPAASGANTYPSTLVFHFRGTPPDRVREGGREEVPRTTAFSWSTVQSPEVPVSRIFLLYGTSSYLLPYRSFRGGGGDIIPFERPSYTCIRSDIDRITMSLQRDDKLEQLGAMTGAYYLLQQPANICPESSKRRLVDLYFQLNCRLAATLAYVAYLDEAERAYTGLQPGDPARLSYARGCRATANRFVANTIFLHANVLVAAGDVAGMNQLASDVDALQGQAGWQGTFDRAAIASARSAAGAQQIVNLLTAQVSAQQARRFNGAASLNLRLRTLLADPSHRDDFVLARVTPERIAQDSAQIAAQMSLATDPQLDSHTPSAAVSATSVEPISPDAERPHKE